jgi:hypothetical protein
MVDTGPICHLLISLDEIRPFIWRRVLVPAKITLPKLHQVFQRVMGWENRHLHEFRFGDSEYGIVNPELERADTIDERRVRLSTFVTEPGYTFKYVYDYGDYWVHNVEVERVCKPNRKKRYPYCWVGAGACPPEDVGGPDGYINFLEALRDPAHEDHEMYRDWIGYDFDPGDFDPDEVNISLAAVHV